MIAARVPARKTKVLTPHQIRSFRKRVYTYYKNHGRRLPWRETRNPYRILVSEVMLQQTQASRVIEKYKQFLKRFPTLRSLAQAELSEILKVWQGLGYNRRALSLKKLAIQIMHRHRGRIPRQKKELMTLSGIGEATASCILAFAFNKPSVFVETNVRSVFIHFFFSKKTQVADSQILGLVSQTLDIKKPRLWYWALMDYGVFLKSNHPNPSRKSSHYKRQSPFKGSNRQLRGKILKTLLSTNVCTVKELRCTSCADKRKIEPLLDAMHREGLIKRDGPYVKVRKYH